MKNQHMPGGEPQLPNAHSCRTCRMEDIHSQVLQNQLCSVPAGVVKGRLSTWLSDIKGFSDIKLRTVLNDSEAETQNSLAGSL